MAEATAKLTIIAELKDEASSAMQRLGNYASDLGGQMGFAADKSGILSSGLAAIGGSTVLSSINAFNKAQETMDRAKGIFEQLPDGINKFKVAIEAGNAAQAKFGFDNETTTLVLAKFANAAGGNMPLALQALQAAMGLSVARSVSLESAMQMLLPTFAGGGRAVKALGINIDDHASTQEAFAAVVRNTAGELEAFGKTASTQGLILKANLGDTLENMGQPLSGVLSGFQKLVNPMLAVANSSGISQPLMQGFGVSLAAVSTYIAAGQMPALLSKLAGAIGLVGVGTEITLGTIIATTAAFLGWVIVIGLIVGAIILLATHWKEVWAFIKQATLDAVSYISGVLQSMVDAWAHLPELIGYVLGVLVVVVKNAINAIGTFLTTTVPAIIANLVRWFAELPGQIIAGFAAIPSRLAQIFNDAASTIKGIISGIISYIASAPGSIVDFGKGALNNMVGVLNRAIVSFNSVTSKVGISLPTIPAFADGGIVTGPTIGLIGEAGPEAIIPLSQAGKFGMGGGGANITINFQGDLYSTREAAEVFANDVAFLIKNQLNLVGVRA